MPWFKVVDPKGVNGHPFNAVVEFPPFAGNALRSAGRLVPAHRPAPRSADADLAEARAKNAPKEESPQAPAEAPDELDGLTVAELKSMLVDAGLSTKGTKAVLVARLRGGE